MTREEIQKAAVEIIGSEGFDKLTMSALASRLEVRKASVYYYFSSKEEIIASLYEAFRIKLKTFSFTLDFSLPAKTVLEGLTAHYETIFFDEALSPYLSLISQRRGIDRSADELDDVLTLMVEAQTEAVITNLIERGKLAFSNPKFLSDLLSSRILTLIRGERINEVEELPAEVTEIFAKA